jgi:hypothetical protein
MKGSPVRVRASASKSPAKQLLVLAGQKTSEVLQTGPTGRSGRFSVVSPWSRDGLGWVHERSTVSTPASLAGASSPSLSPASCVREARALPSFRTPRRSARRWRARRLESDPLGGLPRRLWRPRREEGDERVPPRLAPSGVACRGFLASSESEADSFPPRPQGRRRAPLPRSSRTWSPHVVRRRMRG